jgi:hypothetical protein
MILLLIVPVWFLGLALVAGLCYSARVGDSDLLEMAAKERESRAAVTLTARRIGAPAADRTPLARELAA